MEHIYFISDVHLSLVNGEAESRKREKLLGFLDSITQPRAALYILGDLFDFWFEWHHVIPKYWWNILYKFRQMKEAGMELHFITGNHDFYTGRFLEESVGMTCWDDAAVFEAGGKRFYAAHGDGLAAKDKGYRFLKRVIRHPLSIFLFKNLIPADWGMQLAKWTSHTSRELKQIDQVAWSEEYFRFAEGKFDEGFDVVLLGHVHLPMIREKKGQVYVNCGDWLNHRTYVEFDGRDIHLKKWE